MIEHNSFFLLTQKNFGFLIEKLGHKIYDKRFERTNPWSDGSIEFVSSLSTIKVQKDRGAFIVFMKPTVEPEISEMSLPWILEALSIMRRQELPGEVSPDRFEEALRINAQLLELHYSTISNGDFSSWMTILEYYVNRSKKNYLANTGKKIPDRIHRDLEGYIKSQKKCEH